MSEATYYRFFIEEHLPKNVKNLIYLDADILTINDPIDLINNQFNKMNKSEFFISVRSENETENKNLKLSNSKYFNAGVMLINYEKWLKKDVCGWGTREVLKSSEVHTLKSKLQHRLLCSKSFRLPQCKSSLSQLLGTWH